MRNFCALLLCLFVMWSPRTEASSTTYQYQAVIRDIETNENSQVTTQEILDYLDSVGIGLNQTVSGFVSLLPLVPDVVPNNGLFVQSGAIEAGQFVLSGHEFIIDNGGSILAFNGSLPAIGIGDTIGIAASLSSTLPVTSASIGFAFTDLLGNAISGSDVPVYPINLDAYSPFMLDVSNPSLTTSLLFQFRIPGNALVEFRAEFEYFTSVPLPGTLLLLVGALTPLLFSRSGNQ